MGSRRSTNFVSDLCCKAMGLFWTVRPVKGSALTATTTTTNEYDLSREIMTYNYMGNVIFDQDVVQRKGVHRR